MEERRNGESPGEAYAVAAAGPAPEAADQHESRPVDLVAAAPTPKRGIAVAVTAALAGWLVLRRLWRRRR